ncbi:MAG: hypothetical protein KGO02_23450, partial [Alphaproteobacteria bacterium]|nr:hypothetical protein [Alphaproteobacteria bacterium]
MKSVSRRTPGKAALLIGLGAMSLWAASGGPAAAVPSFARQTGLACEACHTVFPELTPFGRRFKLNGYIINNREQIQDETARRRSLELSFFSPVSAMFVASYLHSSKAQPDSSGLGRAQNDTTSFPQQLSLFYAGEITPHIGSFIQLTYDPTSGSIGMDNTDIRYADAMMWEGSKFNWGISLNNNPTVQDLWNTVPAWYNPYMTGAAAASPEAATLIDQSLAGNIAGATVYGMLNDTWYGEVGVYTSAPQGVGQPYDTAANTLISGGAPYWRFAGEWDWGVNSFEVGTYGMAAHTRFAGACNVLTQLTDANGNPVNVYTTSSGPCQTLSAGPTDDYVDVAFDTQYQYIAEHNIFSFEATWIHEDRTLNSTINASNIANGTNFKATSANLDTARASFSYFYNRTIGGSIDLFDTFGGREPLVFSSRNGKPDSDGITLEADYLPWLNTKLGLAYTIY